MLRIGLDNCAPQATASATSEILGHPASAILDDTSTFWAGQGPCTLSAVFPAPSAVALLFLQRLVFSGTLTITGTLASAPVFSKAFVPADLCGVSVKCLYTGLEGTIDTLTLAFSGSVSTVSLGHLWAGSKQDILFEKLELTDNAADIVSVTTGNYAGHTARPLYRSCQVTLQKTTFATVRDFIRNILLRGYGVPRPVVLLTASCLVDDAMLAIMDSPKTQYDLFESAPVRKVQATIGFSEIFGGV